MATCEVNVAQEQKKSTCEDCGLDDIDVVCTVCTLACVFPWAKAVSYATHGNECFATQSNSSFPVLDNSVSSDRSMTCEKKYKITQSNYITSQLANNSNVVISSLGFSHVPLADRWRVRRDATMSPSSSENNSQDESPSSVSSFMKPSPFMML